MTRHDYDGVGGFTYSITFKSNAGNIADRNAKVQIMSLPY